MCDKGEKSCPICTEMMDLTDQQLKPCKCGYEICVWCWHHIMEMSEKDGTSGRCPACRAPYDKERIVAMAANCQRLVAEMNSQRKKKMQKLKAKSTEGKKHLNDVRVIQRNLVYITGLALNLADEDLLQRKEYFGRYGKVLKASISRTASGLIQHSANNSCCVYITYSKEAEAICCIQSVHCFVLEGRSLRACFGTTKYCHTWLRNMPCSNRDCSYLHDYGSQEDSFTKDELVVAFARSRVQQIIGATNNLHRRSGNVLPPPEDDRHMTSSLKLVSKSSSKIEDQIKGSYSGGGAVSSTASPAATSWVMRVSGRLPPDTSSSCPGNLTNRKDEAFNDPEVLVSVVNSTETSVHNARSGEAERKSEVHSGAKMGCDQDMVAPAAGTGFLKLSKEQCVFIIDKADGNVEGLCSDVSSISMHNSVEDPYCIPDSDRLLSMHSSKSSPKVTSDMGESSIISDILSLELDVWEDSLGKLLAESDEASKALKAPHLRKGQDKNQSRFSFARQDCLMNNSSDLEQAIGISSHVSRGNFASNGLMGNRDIYPSDALSGKHRHVASSTSVLSDKFVRVPKSHASSPPGFSRSSRIPPGFSCGRVQESSNTHVKHLPKQYVPPSGNIDRIGGVQFNDHAMFEIGKVHLAERINNASFDIGRNLFSQHSPGGDDAGLELLMHQSMPLQNLRHTDHAGNVFSPQNDTYRVSSRFDQFPPNNLPTYEHLHSQQFSNVFPSNSQWGIWHDAKNFGDLPIPQVLNNERKRFNDFMPSYEGIKF